MLIMTLLSKHLEKVSFQDKHFIGTIALKSDEITLPDGSKMALGIDGGLWILVYQKDKAIKVYKYDHDEKKLDVDQKAGWEQDLSDFKKHIAYFFNHVQTQDLITLLPPQGSRSEK